MPGTKKHGNNKMPHLDKLRKILDREDVWGNNVLDWLMALLAAAGVGMVLEVT